MNVSPVMLAAILIAAPAAARAQQSELPPILSRAFALLQTDSVDAVTRLWSRTWTAPTDSGKADLVGRTLRGTREIAGPFYGYDIVKTDTISPHLWRTYVLMRYARIPVFGQFLIYDPGVTPGAWQVQMFNWNTDVTKAWPANVWPR